MVIYACARAHAHTLISLSTTPHPNPCTHTDMRTTLACALVLAGCVASISAVPVKKAHKNHAAAPRAAHAAAAAAAAAPKTDITIPCASVPFAECTVDAGKNSEKAHL